MYPSKKERALSQLAEKPHLAIPRPMCKTELAAFLDVSERFLEKEVSLGRLRAIKLSTRALRFMPKDVEFWLNSKATEGASV
jgi:hypothetical protein